MHPTSRRPSGGARFDSGPVQSPPAGFAEHIPEGRYTALCTERVCMAALLDYDIVTLCVDGNFRGASRTRAL